MLIIILQNANEGTAASLFNSFLGAIQLILSDETVVTTLCWIGAFFVVGGWFFFARYFLKKSLKKYNDDLLAREAEENAIKHPPSSRR